MPQDDRARLRRTMRARRRALSPDEAQACAVAFARNAHRARLLRPGRRIAFYFPHGAEADVREIAQLARARHCVLYLPVIEDYRKARMRFRLYSGAEVLRRNRYGIPEPQNSASIATLHLDLVFVPLVAVDVEGRRLGSGAGFYDRCFAHLRPGRTWRKPRLIGVAYEFQRVPHLDAAPWDVPVDAVLTERNLYPTRPNDGAHR